MRAIEQAQEPAATVCTRPLWSDGMWRISGKHRAYDWGSTSAMHDFLGLEPTGEPLAEAWFGTHPLGMSSVSAGGDGVPLAEVAGDLTFMLKVLAPDQPLSIQVHPSRALAEGGFAEENARGIDLADPRREYKDPLDKPEMVYALTRFDTLLGLRTSEEVIQLLTPLQVPVARRLLEHAAEGRLVAVEHLLTSPPDAAELDDLVETCRRHLDSDVKRGYATLIETARIHPGDPGLALTLLLNRVTLQPGEAAFVGPGLMHAHLSGLCLEVMASSDNVFRAGLTTKRVNREGVLSSLDEDQPTDVDVGASSETTQVLTAPSNLFALSVTRGRDDLIPGNGDRILLCIDGVSEVVAGNGQVVELGRGQAAFANAADGALSVRGSGTTAQAFIPG